MKLLLLASLIFVGCGNKIIYVTADIAARTQPNDLASTTVDFAKPADLSVERDLSVALPPEDMHVSLPPDLFEWCTPPAPGVYNDTYNFTYQSSVNPNPTPGSNSLYVIVRNDGTFERPADNMTAPAFFHCSTPPTIDSMTCLAPCCAGPPATVPTIYYFNRGWRLFKSGTCLFKDPNSNVMYLVQFTSITGT